MPATDSPLSKLAFSRLLVTLTLMACALSGAQAAHQEAAGSVPESALPIALPPVIVLLVPAASGGPEDQIARSLAQQLAVELPGSTLAIEYQPAGQGHPGVAAAANAKPDGSTLLLAWTSLLAVQPHLYRKLPYDPAQFAGIGLVADIPHLLTVNAQLPADDLTQFTSFVQRHPGELHFASSGNGSLTHLAGQLYMSVTETNMVHLPYSSAGHAINNLVSGDIQAMFPPLPSMVANVRNGRVKALGVMSAARSPLLPEVPTMEEQGQPLLMAGNWFALLAPPDTPAPIVAQLNHALNAALASFELQDTLASQGAIPLGGSPQDYELHLRRETEKWRASLADAHLLPATPPAAAN